MAADAIGYDHQEPSEVVENTEEDIYEDEEDDDPDFDDYDRQISENTGSRLDIADQFDSVMLSDPRSRRPARNQGGRSGKPKAKPHQKIHHRELKKRLEEDAAKAVRQVLDTPLYGTQRSDVQSYSQPSSSQQWGLPYNRQTAITDQARRHDPASEAARAHGAPLLSAAALGLDEATYQTLINLQFREINPEDYNTLSVLDETVAPKSLDRKKLTLFPTKRVEEGAAGLEVVDSAGNRAALKCENCIVCMDTFVAGDELRHLTCGHSFHRECIDEWFERSTKCPSDNVEIA